MENKLEVIVKESGLEATKAKIMLDNFKYYFAIAAEWEVKAKAIKVTDESQEVDMQMARAGRLFLREKRIAIEKTRKGLKEQALREGKAIDGIANVLKSLIVPIEEYLTKQEKFVEIKEAEKKEAERIALEKKEEEERIENERLTRLADERRKLALPFSEFWTADYDFRIMSQANFESVMTDLKQRKSEHDKEQERIRKENEKLQREAAERERRHKEERERQEARAEEIKRQSEAKRKEQEAKARAEQERIQKEADAKIEKERKEKELLEEKLKNQIECPYCHKKFQIEK